MFNFNLSSDTMLAVQAADEGFKASVWTLVVFVTLAPLYHYAAIPFCY